MGETEWGGGVQKEAEDREDFAAARGELPTWGRKEGRGRVGEEEQIYSNVGLFPKQDVVEMARAQLM